MSYFESQAEGLTTIRLVCDARKGKGICLNDAEVTMQDKAAVQRFLHALGWGLLRGKHVCGSCLAKGLKNVHFPREVAQ